MTLHHYYRETDGSLVDMSAYAPRYITTQSRAEESAVGSWSVVLDDPDGELDLAGHRQWFIEDDESESEDDIIWGGFTGAQTIARMQGDAHRVIGPLARALGPGGRLLGIHSPRHGLPACGVGANSRSSSCTAGALSSTASARASRCRSWDRRRCVRGAS